MTDGQTGLIGREFRHFKMHLRRSRQVPRRATRGALRSKVARGCAISTGLRGFAKDSETLEEMVVYRALYGERGLWVRPAKMFFETIERDGRTMKRFEPVEDEQ